jgi:diaminopimelate decarboxylase
MSRIDEFLSSVRPPTPCVVIDLDIVPARFRALTSLFPDVSIYYAVKANPAPEIITVLAELNCCFDLASPGEMERCRDQTFRSGPRVLLEPGRYMVGDAGVLRSEVVLVAKRPHPGGHRWVYLDAGRYNGLPETQGEVIQYRIRTSRDSDPARTVILAGPTCDSTDIIYEHAGHTLPLTLAAGDHLDFLSAGAYTSSYASVAFNGFAPVRTLCI